MKRILILFFFTLTTLYAQEYEVTDTVTDDAKDPLPGVSIVIKGTTKGTQTDFDGKYTIKVKNGDILEFSYIGMKIKQVKVTGQKIINVVLEEDNVTLQEVVVTTGYVGKRNRKKDKQKKAVTYDIYEPSRETYKAIDESGFKSTATDPVTTFSADVDKASYSNVRRMINYGQKPDEDAVRIEELINYFDYNYTPPAEGSKTPLNATQR